jgi:hypothetical protein
MKPEPNEAESPNEPEPSPHAFAPDTHQCIHCGLSRAQHRDLESPYREASDEACVVAQKASVFRVGELFKLKGQMFRLDRVLLVGETAIVLTPVAKPVVKGGD